MSRGRRDIRADLEALGQGVRLVGDDDEPLVLAGGRGGHCTGYERRRWCGGERSRKCQCRSFIDETRSHLHRYGGKLRGMDVIYSATRNVVRRSSGPRSEHDPLLPARTGRGVKSPRELGLQCVRLSDDARPTEGPTCTSGQTCGNENLLNILVLDRILDLRVSTVKPRYKLQDQMSALSGLMRISQRRH